jgi:hypothetical protein
MTESTGWDTPASSPAPASPAEAPREFTADELEAARAQLAAQGADLGTGQAASGADLGAQAVAAGAAPTEVDAQALLEQVRALQARVANMEHASRMAQAPDVVKYATALRDHLAVKANQHPAIAADPDHNFNAVLGAANDLVSGAEAAAESGNPGKLGAEVGAVESWVAKHARRFPHIDYSYILDLAGEAAQAVAALAA